LGAYGLYVAAGKTVETIEREIRALVAEKIKKDPGFVSARIVTRASKVYYVLGEVNAPGVFPVTGRETVLDGLIAAGGLNDRASRRNIILVRPTHPDSCRIVLPVCYRQIVQLGDTTTNYQLAPGDRIFVPSRNFHDQFRGRRRESNCACGGPQTSCLQGGSCGNPAGVLPVSVPVPYAPAPQLESLPAPVVAPK
jgi:protein involved in polysaccharide export with SLBB domain